jgi:hypothetical protein
MSGNDAFDRAVRALRETGETPSADVARTRARMLETLQRGERRGRRTFWVLLPIAAVLAASTAIAKNTEAVRRVWTSVAETIGIATPLPHSAPLAVPKRGLAARPASGTESEEGMPPASTAEVVPAPVPADQPASTASEKIESGALDDIASRASKAPTSGSREAPSPANQKRRANVAGPSPTTANAPPEAAMAEPRTATPDDGEAAALRLYKNAYRLHFTEQRYAAALAAWDEYLRAAPTGRLVVEARYNRAIALARLGRRADAEAALTPFARGEVSGGYRSQEARELLDALRASAH